MHKLQRGNAPACLTRFRHGRDNWDAVTSNDKVEIWTELDAMQGPRCAYCEGDISHGHGKHIEHFRQKGRDPTVTFAWSNLFGSCNRSDSCGKHKDDCGIYDPVALLKPDVDDPERFFIFVNDGTIAVRSGLSAAERHRATETLRIFNLDAQHGPLRRMRQQAAAGYIQTCEELVALAAEYPPEEWQPLLDNELITTAHLPFATAIKHVLTRQSDYV